MQYKVGDEVLIKGEVVEVAKDVTYPIGVRLRCATVPMLFTEDELELSTKTYTQGLADAWELARKIVLSENDGGYDSVERMNIFGKSTYYTLKCFTYEEALAKIEAYEKEIKVGDVVTNGKYICVVTNKIDENNSVILYGDGCFGKIENKFLEKTGKHIDIESLLKQIGE